MLYISKNVSKVIGLNFHEYFLDVKIFVCYPSDLPFMYDQGTLPVQGRPEIFVGSLY
jgi:hypothetical protein